jgi:phosphoglycolate phosphatase-like HAD superfamily hydrolase
MSNNIIYALDFDGVLVDSAGETAQSGLRGAQILWPSSTWMITDSDSDHNEVDEEQRQVLSSLTERFREIRPILYVGWESILLVKLILDPNEGRPSNEDILQTFHSGLKDKMMQSSGFSESDFARAMKTARDSWIAQNNAEDWINTHGYFEGACQAVKEYLQNCGNKNIYIITTKAKEFAERLLEHQGLYNGGGDRSKLLEESHIFGLGSGSKAHVLQSILDGRQGDIGVMVEDNIATLDEIMASPIRNKVLPVVASWGYTTKEQLKEANDKGYVMLSESDSASLGMILNDTQVQNRYQRNNMKVSPV